MSDTGRYLLAQLPGWLFVAVLVDVLVDDFGLPPWIWVAVPLAVLKDILMIPVVRRAWGPPRVGAASMIGARGEAIEAVAPTGYVRVRGELWEAEARGAAAAIPKGRPVIVREMRGLTLVVDEADRAG